MSELHLFIVWKNALDKKEEILNDINKTFDIVEVYNINWSKKLYSNNLSRFYGTNLPSGCEKEKHCGKGEFLLIIVKDNNPIYENRSTSKGIEIVNINMFDKKSYYRKITGGGHKVHATNSVQETNHDLTLLLGKNSKDYMECHNFLWDGNIKKIKQDLIGAKNFNSAKEMFYLLNNCTNYAILRNYETLPDEIYINKHNDIDLICESKDDVAYILNATKAQNLDYRVQYFVKIEDKIANFDLRYIGDKYYDENLEIDMLDKRIFNEKGFYTLNNEYYFYTLLYHALIHKREIANDYIKKLDELDIDINSFDLISFIKQLDEWLINNKYIIERPEDLSVFFNEENLKHFSRLVYRRNLKEIELQNKVEELTEKLDMINHSRTWRYTEFIRKANKILKNKVKNKYKESCFYITSNS